MFRKIIKGLISLLYVFILNGCSEPKAEQQKSHQQKVNPKEFKFVAAKTGLRLREGPSLRDKIIETIPPGKIVQVPREIQKTQELNGQTKWSSVKYRWRDGWVYNAYLKDLKPVKNLRRASEYVGTWKGSWKCGQKVTHVEIRRNHEFTGWIFSGADEGGCGGFDIKGTWQITRNGYICLIGTVHYEPCFFIWHQYLIANAREGKPLRANYDWEIVSGLKRSTK